MGRMKEEFELNRRQEIELEIARAEATYDALPQSLIESHAMICKLQKQISVLLDEVRATGPKWVERLYGFGFGVIASLVATAVWPKLAHALPFLR